MGFVENILITQNFQQQITKNINFAIFFDVALCVENSCFALWNQDFGASSERCVHNP